MEGEGPPPSPTLFLDRVGEVVVTLHPDGLSWKPVHADLHESSCLTRTFLPSTVCKIKFSDVYSVELADWGFIYDPRSITTYFHSSGTEMNRFVIRGVRRPKKCPSSWVLSEHTFGYKDLKICQAWVEHLNTCISNEQGRPKSLLVFVHPLCGKGNGCKTWETVAPIFCQAKVQTKVTITQRAGHAYDMIAALSDSELRSFDGIVAVGGDGLFNEILNGLLTLRHNAPYPPAPTEFSHPRNDDQSQGKGSISMTVVHSNLNAPVPESSYESDAYEPLLSKTNGMSVSRFTTKNGPCNGDEVPSVTFPNDWFRLGIIPAGSTDAIVLSTTGVRDPITSALHIILGSKMPLDIAQIVRWKAIPSSDEDSPTVRYAASFAGYGFYGEVVRESEQYRWMGPVRYDYAGTRVFLKHRSYEAEIAYMKEEPTSNTGSGPHPSQTDRRRQDRLICRANCFVCKGATVSVQDSAEGNVAGPTACSRNSKWLRSKGHFLSVGAAVISCRNERAPDGLVADAHLADGFLHLILIKDCPRPCYLWHLTRLTRKGSDPLNFRFVEHHKTPAFTFLSRYNEGVWNIDGEIFPACQLSVQACRGLVNMFASGPEV